MNLGVLFQVPLSVALVSALQRVLYTKQKCDIVGQIFSVSYQDSILYSILPESCLVRTHLLVSHSLDLL